MSTKAKEPSIGRGLCNGGEGRPLEQRPSASARGPLSHEYGRCAGDYPRAKVGCCVHNATFMMPIVPHVQSSFLDGASLESFRSSNRHSPEF
jgi:hypothetical protein